GGSAERAGPAGVLAPDRFEAGVAAAALSIRIIAIRVRAVEVLVVVLGRVEVRDRLDRRRHRLVEAGGYGLERLLGDALLLGVAVVEDGAVLRAPVAELAVHREGVDVVPEHLDERLEADHG